MNSESFIMRAFRRIGLDSIAWSFRRLHVPVKKNDLVLEVGSGGNPYFRANVLLDAYETTQERHWAPLTKDRPTVLGFVENLPFKDKAFDFVIASHVLEHSCEPELFLNELMRVSKAGYIEVPHAFMERITAYFDHRLEILEEENTLVIRKKTNWIVDEDLQRLFKNKPVEVFSRHLISKKPFHFHVRHYWKEKISYKVTNPEVKIEWVPPQSSTGLSGRDLRPIARSKSNILAVIRLLFSQNTRNKNINLLDLIQCTNCKSNQGFDSGKGQIICQQCHSKYSWTARLVDLRASI